MRGGPGFTISEGCSRIEFAGKFEQQFFNELTNIMTLEHLILPESTTDHDLEYIGRISTLKTLMIQHSEHVTDEGIAFLSDLSNLEDLHLFCLKKLSDRSTETLKKLKSLKKLNLDGTAISEAAVAELKRSLTDCEIRR